MDKIVWESAGDFEDIRYEKFEQISKITINRPQVRNAFRPETVREMSQALRLAEHDKGVGVIILPAKATRRSVRAATRKSAATAAIRTQPDRRAWTCWSFSGRYEDARR